MAVKNVYRYGEVYTLGSALKKEPIKEFENSCVELIDDSSGIFYDSSSGISYDVIVPKGSNDFSDQIEDSIVLGLLYDGEEIEQNPKLYRERINYLVLYDNNVESEHLMDHIKLVKFKNCKRSIKSMLTSEIGGKLKETDKQYFWSCEKHRFSNVWPDIADRSQIVLSILARYDYDSATPAEKEILSMTRHNMVNILVEEAERKVYATYGYDPLVADYANADYFGNKIAKTVTYVANSNVRIYAGFISDSKKMVKDGSLVEAIEFYEKVPKELKAQYDKRADIANQKKEERFQRKKQKEEIRERKVNESKKEHYKL